ncbi:MAG: hypothetical protein B0D96_01545 [Candidatus Sedimenticola endophacoides]|uniref:PqqD family protein n=1 Tax=Candidatus Sedimenticola endophacoides TaxID=2548426 RepID=A0A6N4DMS8_9GAMM|nr:MAG: hypothetical protein B0D94_10915 [Candidatus Sedimenticola endophacoides]OQX37710.1 MAG: hypothetical protein B0D96_01545 [Candidatus Sedimenticola endophacoides]OQX39045.1 MAG: hypothetical protein B0D89_11565 [Candidatus Sedimenticola endophacoides]PUD98284.1 MAG: hypothetical protein C3L24_13080 [Candidatus Sedimenticola endophacoides]PUD98882.1 MAG: hypothetical protein C3L26_11035 [Candidatus Sedimenticola endophacoides]
MPTHNPLTLVLARKPGIEYRSISDSGFLASPDTGTLYHLNPTGSAIWHLLEQPTTHAEITSTLQAAFPNTPAELIVSDVKQIVTQLLERQLITIYP